MEKKKWLIFHMVLLISLNINVLKWKKAKYLLTFILRQVVVITVVSSVAGAAAAIVDDEDSEDE